MNPLFKKNQNQFKGIETNEDVSEAETLRRLADMGKFNRWMWSQVEPWVGEKILEVGCGLGNFSRFIADRKRVVAIDSNRKHLEEFRHRNPDLEQFELHVFDAGDPKLVELGDQMFDTIICLNVLEHVENHEEAIRSFYKLLEPGGQLAVLVPAFPALFGTLDLNGPHFRRYTWNNFRSLLTKHDFEILHMKYFNLFGIPGWWFCGKILRRPILPANGLGVYEKLMPVFHRIEKWIGPPVGLSIIGIGRKPK